MNEERKRKTLEKELWKVEMREMNGGVLEVRMRNGIKGKVCVFSQLFVGFLLLLRKS